LRRTSLRDKTQVKSKVKAKVKVKENFENFEDEILENKAEVQVKVKAKVKVKGFGVCLVSLGPNASAPERRFVVPKSSCIL
jgi:hypothetical protein